MPPLQSPESHSANSGTPMIGLFVIMGAVVIGFPIVIIIALVGRRCLNRRRIEEQRRARYQLREFKLQPTRQEPILDSVDNGASPLSSIVSKNFPIHSTPPTPHSGNGRARSRLSRPLNLPIRKSILQSQPITKPEAPDQLNQPPKSPRHLLRASISSISSTYTTQSLSDSPISPMSSTAPLSKSKSQISIPQAAHTTRRHTDRWSRHLSRHRSFRWSQRLSRPFSPLIDLDFGRDLFLAIQNSGIAQRESQMGIEYFDAQKGEVATTQVRKGEVTTGVPVRVESDQTTRVGISVEHEGDEQTNQVPRRDTEWQHARLETVDGVLAPREWL